VTDEDAFEQLRWATQALALDPPQQLALFPEFVDKPFELIDDYDNWYRATSWREAPPISADQRAALATLHDAVSSLPNNLLSQNAVRVATEWSDLRTRARHVLDLFGWSCEPPPTGRAAYVPTNA
jgi:hypothetical protein